MNLSLVKYILLLSFLVSSSLLLAQDDKPKTGNVGDEEVTVVKAYQPTLSDAIKISDVPQKDTAVFIAPNLNYTVEPKKLESKYNITPIKPVKIKDETIKKLYRGFVKAGYGNYKTPYLDALYNAIRSKEFNAGIHFHHLSSSGTISDYGFPGFSENNLELFGDKYLESSILSAKVKYDRDVVHYYGFNPETEGLQSKKATMHRMGTFSGDFSLSSSHNDKDRFDYNAGIAFYNFSDNRLDDTTLNSIVKEPESESDFQIKGMAGKHLANDHYIKADISIDISKSEFTTGLYSPVVISGGTEISTNRTIFRINPRYEFSKSEILISAGANIAIEHSYDETHYHLYPFANLKYPLIKEELSIFGQLSGEIKKNSLLSLNKENPFMLPSVITGNNVLMNTNDKFDITGGIVAKPDRAFQLLASASFSRLLDDVFFVNSTNPEKITTYHPVYYDNSQINIHAEAQYMQNDKLGIHLKMDYFSYDVPDSVEPWFKPSYLFTLGGNYNIADKIYTKMELYYVGSSKAISADGSSFDLKSYIDLNLGIDYRYSKALSIFLNINNLTAQRYSRWYNYPSYRINALAGISYSF